MEPYVGYTYYDYTDISVNNFNRRTSSIGSNTSEYSFFISEDEIVNAFDRHSESTISLSSLEDNENIEKNNFKSIRLSSSGSLDSQGLKKTRSKKELFVKRTLKKRRKKDDICFINGKECINTRTPTPIMFNSLNSYFNK
tara:strand:+ start:204 stop:623 length:420 start_codon:yes stop_codon:yes gene_type:complete